MDTYKSIHTGTAIDEAVTKVQEGIPKATTSTLGGIKTGYTTSNKNYKVDVDSNGNAYCSVNWTDTTYTIATSSKNGLMSSTDKQTLDNVPSTYLKKADNYAYGINTFTTNNDYATQMSIKSKDGDVYTIKFADASTLVDLTTAQSISGAKTFTNKIKTNTINNESDNAMARTTDSKVVLGNATNPTTIMGSGDRPTYSKSGSDLTGVPLALLSDCGSGGGTKIYRHMIEATFNTSVSVRLWTGSGYEYITTKTMNFIVYDNSSKSKSGNFTRLLEDNTINIYIVTDFIDMDFYRSYTPLSITRDVDDVIDYYSFVTSYKGGFRFGSFNFYFNSVVGTITDTVTEL